MPRQTDKHFKVRLSPEMHAWLAEKARENHRTKTAEIAYHLEKAKISTELAAGDASRA